MPGCLDMVNFGPVDTVPAQFKHRHLYSWAPTVTLMRTDASENAVLGQQLGQKVSQSQAAVTVVLPRNGLSQLDAEGHDFYDPALDNVLFEAIKSNLSGTVQLIESPIAYQQPGVCGVINSEPARTT